MAHLITGALKKNSSIDHKSELWKKFDHQYLLSQWRVIQLQTEIEKVSQVFEENRIDHILLKGSVLRNLYPEPWMRVSGDIDILVHSEKLSEAEQILVEKLYYTVTSEGAHHDHVTAPNGFHIDLHFTLTERIAPATHLLDDVWNRTELVAGKQHEYRMTDEMFYLFHMFHASVHFQNGGCGMRMLIDTWLLNHKVVFDQSKRYMLLEEAGLLTFARMMEEISEKWMTEDAVSDMSDDKKKVLSYILYGGIYGGKQKVAAGQANAGGTNTGYFVSRAFLPYKTMTEAYPILKKHRYLLPFCWGHRLIKAMYDGKTKKARKEMSIARRDRDKSKEMKEMFERLGL